MALYSGGLTSIQIAKESSVGVDLATTSKLAVETFNVKSVSERYVPQLLRGLLQANAGGEVTTKRSVEIDFEGPLTFENGLLMLLNGAITALAAPTSGSDPYTWTFTRNPAAVPAVATFTIERNDTDGSSPYGHAWHYVVIDELEITFSAGQALRYKAHAFGRATQSETLTSAISLPTPETAIAGLSTVKIDTSFAGLGGTAVASQMLNAKLTIRNGAVPIWTLDSRSDLDYTTVGHDRSKIKNLLEMQALLGAQYSTEKTAALEQTLRAVQLSVAGTNSRTLTIGGIFKHANPDLIEFSEVDGQKTYGMMLEETADGTNLITATVVNHVATLA